MDIFDFAGCGQFAQPLRDAANKFALPIEFVPYWLGQLTIESRAFTRTEENLNYRSDTLLRVCNGRNGITSLDAATAAVMRGPLGVGEALYGLPWGARLGNSQTGDGYRFRGRGLIQITGRSNYQRCSLAMYQDNRLLDQPELLSLADGAAMSAAWFVVQRNLTGLRDVEAITHGVNGGDLALAQREAATGRLLAYNP